MTASASNYVGRFAPSPTGPLHFGSLVAALASYLDAKSCAGRWLVRVEDIDPPREIPGARDAILNALVAHGLDWDGEILLQSQRTAHYKAALAELSAQRHTYACSCSRQRLRSLPNGYDGQCLSQPPTSRTPAAIKLKSRSFSYQFEDLIQGRQSQLLHAPQDDFVLWRKDGLVAYQLAVVVDDLAQGVNHVVRGSDLLDSTVRQALLLRLMGAEPPAYGHLPVASKQDGQKLSKQNHAAALDNSAAAANLVRALQFLGQAPPEHLLQGSVQAILRWGCEHWHRGKVPASLAIAVD